MRSARLAPSGRRRSPAANVGTARRRLGEAGRLLPGLLPCVTQRALQVLARLLEAMALVLCGVQDDVEEPRRVAERFHLERADPHASRSPPRGGPTRRSGSASTPNRVSWRSTTLRSASAKPRVGAHARLLAKAGVPKGSRGATERLGREQEVRVPVGACGTVRVKPGGNRGALEENRANAGVAQRRNDLRGHRVDVQSQRRRSHGRRQPTNLHQRTEDTGE